MLRLSPAPSAPWHSPRRARMVLQALANLYLGNSYQYQGDYPLAIACFRQTMQPSRGGGATSVSVRSTRPPCCAGTWRGSHAELGTFTAGRTLGEEGLRIAEAVRYPVSVMYASRGVGLLALRQGDVPSALSGARTGGRHWSGSRSARTCSTSGRAWGQRTHWPGAWLTPCLSSPRG